MKRFRYFISGLLMALFILAGTSNLNAQQATIQFLATYTNAEVTSLLNRDDRFFQLIELKGTETQGPILGYCQPENTGEALEYLTSSVFRDRLPCDIQFSWGRHGEEHGLPIYGIKSEEDNYKGPTQSDIENVEVVTGESTGDLSLLLTFTKKGAEKWAKLTGRNIGKSLAIIIDDTVWSAPVVREEIRMGKCQISGNFSPEELQALKVKLDPIF
jgi:hypothetical protein